MGGLPQPPAYFYDVGYHSDAKTRIGISLMNNISSESAE